MMNLRYFIAALLGFLVLAFSSEVTYAQYSLGGKPLSLRNDNSELSKLQKIEKKTLSPVNVDSIKQAEKALRKESKKPIPPRFGVAKQVNYNLENAGKWQELANGGRVWRLKIHSPGAKSLNFIFDQFHLPKGARLYIFNPKENHVLGAFSHKNNKESGKFATDLLKGETAIIEYYEPFGRNGDLSLSKVIHGYKKSLLSTHTGDNESAGCNNDNNCPVAADWCVEKRSVGMILVDDNTRHCSGALLNNTNQNSRLLFLTAEHCLRRSGNELDPSTLVFRFFYWSTSCNSGNSVNDFISLSGSNVLAQRGRSQNPDGTDFALLEITDPRPEGISLHFMGWNRTNNIPVDGVGIHHPSGDMMKYSFADNIDRNGDFWEVDPWDDGTRRRRFFWISTF